MNYTTLLCTQHYELDNTMKYTTLWTTQHYELRNTIILFILFHYLSWWNDIFTALVRCSRGQCRCCSMGSFCCCWDSADCSWVSADCSWDIADCSWDSADCSWDSADCSWDSADCSWGRRETWSGLFLNTTTWVTVGGETPACPISLIIYQGT